MSHIETEKMKTIQYTDEYNDDKCDDSLFNVACKS